MKIIIGKLKPFRAETEECQSVITNIMNTGGDTDKFISALDEIDWSNKKTEMGLWIDVLNKCDEILYAAHLQDKNGTFGIDINNTLESHVLSVLRFTSFLFERTMNHSIYASMERLITLLDCRKMNVVVQVLRVLVVISQSSCVILQLAPKMRTELRTKLSAIVEAWSGRRLSSVAVEFCSKTFSTGPVRILICNEVPTTYKVNLDKPIVKSMGEMNALFSSVTDEAERTLASFKLRFAYASNEWNGRICLMMARLIATSVFIYSRCLISEEWRPNSLANNKFIEICCEILHSELRHTLSTALKADAFDALASVVYLAEHKKIEMIVDHLEMRSYHGFLPSQIRSCIEGLKAGMVDVGSNAIVFARSLFWFVSHISGFDFARHALHGVSMITVFLDVVDSLTEQFFVTRAMQIIDNLIRMDITDFNFRGGIEIVIKRFIDEVNSKEHIFCNQQRSALIHMFLSFFEGSLHRLPPQSRRIMGTELPLSLSHLFANPGYFGPSLLHFATTLTTNFIFQEPAQLTTLQSAGLTNAIMELIIGDNFPITNDLGCALPELCLALCLNERGLNELKEFQGKKPLEKMFRIIFSNKFLQPMRQCKTEIVDTARELGKAFDKLIRHQPSLREELMSSLAAVIDNWRSFEKNCAKEGKQCAIVWEVGKTLVEDETTLVLLPLGNYLAMFGTMVKTMLNNRGVQDRVHSDNAQAATSFGISCKLIELFTNAKQLSPLVLQSNYLPMLADILRYTHRQNAAEAFLKLCEQISRELNDQCETVGDVSQLTPLCAMLTVLNCLMKASLQSHSTSEMLPSMLGFFAAESDEDESFIYALFNAYKVISCTSTEQHPTTSQVIEHTAEVSELPIGNELGSQPEVLLMDVDNSTMVRNSGTAATMALTTPTTLLTDPAATSSSTAPVEQSAHYVAMRSLKQMAKLITYIGKASCTVSMAHTRQGGQAAQLEQATMQSQKITKLVFGGLKRLLEIDDMPLIVDKIDLCAFYFYHSLLTTERLLLNYTENLQLFLQNFYNSGCHSAFFAISEKYLRTNIDKVEFNLPVQVWIGITQRLIFDQLADITNRNEKIDQQTKQQVVEGFNYLTICQKDAFAAFVNLFNSLVQLLPDVTKKCGKDEGAMFILLERLLYAIRVLVEGMLKFLKLTEGKETDANQQQNGDVDAADTATTTPMEEKQSQRHSITPEVEPEEHQTKAHGLGKEMMTAQDDMSFKPLKRKEFQNMVDLLCTQVVDKCLRLVRCSRLVAIGLSELVSVFFSDALASSWVDVQFIDSIITELDRQLDELTTTKCDKEPKMGVSPDADSNNKDSGDVSTDDEELAQQLASLLQLFCQLWQKFPSNKIYKRLD